MLSGVFFISPNCTELLCRVFWRPVGRRSANRSDTIQRRLVLRGLETGAAYEVVVKAGNGNGTSQLTAPLQFITADQFIIATPATSNVGGAAGIALAVLAVLGLVTAIVVVLRKRNLIVLSVKQPASPSVAFENPFYTVRESSNSTQVHQCTDSHSRQISQDY